MNKHMPKRLLALFLAAVTLLSTAAPALAMDDLSGIGDLPDIVDVGGEIVDIGSPDATVTPTDPAPDDSEWENPSSEEESSSSPEDDSQDEQQPPESEASSSEEETGTPPTEDQQQAASEPTVGASGLDPPDGFSFPVAMDSGNPMAQYFRSRSSGHLHAKGQLHPTPVSIQRRQPAARLHLYNR